MFKRNNELVDSVNNIINSTQLSTNDNEDIKKLLHAYENVTYQEHKDRHQFYRDMVECMVNDMGFEDDELAARMANEHPTLQQNFMRMAVKFIAKMAKEDKYFDGRNEASVKLAQNLMEIIKKNEYLPYV